MRDPKRIRVFCNRLASAWESVPDLRFGQLVSNVFADLQSKGKDPFYPEDDEMIAVIEESVYGSKYHFGGASNG